MSLEINKSIICDLLQCKSLSQVEQAVFKKFNDEISLLKGRIASQAKELDECHAKALLLSQLNFEAQLREREQQQLYDEMLGEMKDKLDRKEFFMQNKERKWLEIEKILEEYVEEDDELRDKLLELRLNVTASSAKKITNVVSENDKLKVQLDNAHEEIGRLRKQLLTIGMGSMKTDANGRLVTHSPKAATQPLNFDVDPDDELEGIDDDENDDD